jgi:uncharacterized membrane protein YdfJ with MMPL/SSD domain
VLEDHRLFAALGRFTVRFRWLIVAAWVIVAVVLSVALPPLSSVEKSSNSDFLPATVPSMQAGRLAAPFNSQSQSDATFVAAAPSGALTAADDAAIDRAEAAIRSVPRVTAVLDQGVSANGRARKALVELNLPSPSNGKVTTRTVEQLRSAFTTSGSHPGVAMHLTGSVAQSVDEQNQTSHIQMLTELLSFVFIVLLLLLTFRALLAPLVALLPSAVALFAAGPIIAQSSHIGVQVSDLTPILLVVVMLGAGTDYGLFLIFRVREELRRGMGVDEAVSFSLCKVGESITFSGLTVIGALATLVIGLVFFGGLALSMLAYSPTGFGNQAAPATSDSGKGQAILATDYPSTGGDPTSVLFRLPAPAWNDPQLLATAQQRLERTGDFESVTGALNPNGVMLTPAELTDAHDRLAALGPAATLPVTPPPGVAVPADIYSAYQASAQFISPDGRTVQYETTLRAGPSTSTAAAAAMPAVRAAVGQVGRSIGASTTGVNGYAPDAADVGAISGKDLVKIIPIVMLVLALLLAIVLRSLVAPLYLVASVGLSYLASLGLAVLVFVIIGGQDGINFVLPFFMFVFIMALGQDYNILVMTRIREEAHHAPIRVAVRRAVEATGTTVTSAGLILAGTFGVLTATGNTQVKEIGLGLAAGILLDTFFVRTLLVPSVVVLLGRWNWWPSKLSHEDHSHDPEGPEWEEIDAGAAVAQPVPPVVTPVERAADQPMAGTSH